MFEKVRFALDIYKKLKSFEEPYPRQLGDIVPHQMQRMREQDMRLIWVCLLCTDGDEHGVLLLALGVLVLGVDEVAPEAAVGLHVAQVVGGAGVDDVVGGNDGAPVEQAAALGQLEVGEVAGLDVVDEQEVDGPDAALQGGHVLLQVALQHGDLVGQAGEADHLLDHARQDGVVLDGVVVGGGVLCDEGGELDGAVADVAAQFDEGLRLVVLCVVPWACGGGWRR